MNQNPIIKALKEELAKERIECSVKYESKCMCGQDSYKFGHEAASARLLGLLEKAVEMAEGIENCALGGLDFTSEKKYLKMRSDVALKLAREFLTTLADDKKEI